MLKNRQIRASVSHVRPNETSNELENYYTEPNVPAVQQGTAAGERIVKDRYAKKEENIDLAHRHQNRI